MEPVFDVRLSESQLRRISEQLMMPDGLDNEPAENAALAAALVPEALKPRVLNDLSTMETPK